MLQNFSLNFLRHKNPIRIIVLILISSIFNISCSDSTNYIKQIQYKYSDLAKFILQSQKSDLRVGSDEFAINFKNQTGYDFNLTQSDYLKQGNLLRDYVTMQDETVMTKA